MEKMGIKENGQFSEWAGSESVAFETWVTNGGGGSTPGNASDDDFGRGKIQGIECRIEARRETIAGSNRGWGNRN